MGVPPGNSTFRFQKCQKRSLKHTSLNSRVRQAKFQQSAKTQITAGWKTQSRKKSYNQPVHKLTSKPVVQTSTKYTYVYMYISLYTHVHLHFGSPCAHMCIHMRSLPGATTGPLPPWVTFPTKMQVRKTTTTRRAVRGELNGLNSQTINYVTQTTPETFKTAKQEVMQQLNVKRIGFNTPGRKPDVGVCE